MMEAPDGELPMDGDRCDPRLRAAACDPGFVCLPVPGGRIYQGRCVEGDGCAITGDSGCPEDQPYCHLRGLSTECTQLKFSAISFALFDCILPIKCHTAFFVFFLLIINFWNCSIFSIASFT